MTWDSWQCPCPECNGRIPDAPDEREEWSEPEHPENVSPERQGYEGWAGREPEPPLT